MIPKELKDKFLSRIPSFFGDQCLSWKGRKETSRVSFRVEGKRINLTAHVVSAIVHGIIKEDQNRYVGHKCSHSWCINPNHLEKTKKAASGAIGTMEKIHDLKDWKFNICHRLECPRINRCSREFWNPDVCIYYGEHLVLNCPHSFVEKAKRMVMIR